MAEQTKEYLKNSWIIWHAFFPDSKAYALDLENHDTYTIIHDAPKDRLIEKIIELPIVQDIIKFWRSPEGKNYEEDNDPVTIDDVRENERCFYALNLSEVLFSNHSKKTHFK